VQIDGKVQTQRCRLECRRSLLLPRKFPTPQVGIIVPSFRFNVWSTGDGRDLMAVRDRSVMIGWDGNKSGVRVDITA
jgi:hypothetical protein